MTRVLAVLIASTALWAVPAGPAVAQKGRPQLPANKGPTPTKVSAGNPAILVETYDTADRFGTRLGGSVRTVDFDDVETAADPTPFAADRYKEKLGVVVTGQDGQFAGRTFQYPRNFVPRSRPNTYAPGPRGKANGPVGDGGNRTVVTFFDGGRAGAVSGFGAHFIDVNHPGIGKSALIAYDAEGRELAREEGFSGGTGAATFRGVVTLDRAGNPVPVIAKVVLVNGSGWPEVYNNEGVTLDDFVFSVPGRGGPAPAVAVAPDRPKGTPPVVIAPDRPKGAPPESGAELLARAHAARTAGRLDEAVRLYGEVLRRNPTLLDAYLGRGDIYRRQYKTAESIAYYSRVIELAPADARGFASRATTLLGAGKLDDALRDLNRAIGLNPSYAFAIRKRAELFVLTGKLDEALADIGAAIRLEPEKAEHYFYRGVIRLARDDVRGAWEDARAAVRADPNDCLGHYLKAVVCSLHEQYDRALTAVDEAVRLEPGNAGLLAERAVVLARLGRADEALRTARKAADTDPRFPGIHRGLGMALWAKGEYREAVTAFGRAIAADPTAGDAYEVRALCHLALNQPALAGADVRRVLEVMPGHPRAQDAAARYYRAAGDPRAGAHETRAKELRERRDPLTGN